MSIALAFSGKAGKKGHESWGMPDEPRLSDRLYLRSKREDDSFSRMEIELRDFQGVVQTYYTYMIANKVAQAVTGDSSIVNELHGRAGSYFSMTLRVENGYIPDVFTLYDIFDRVFMQHIMGTVLTHVDTDGFLTYTIASFSEGETIFQQAECELRSQVASLAIDRLPAHYTTGKGAKIQILNVKDTRQENINQVLFADSEVIVTKGRPMPASTANTYTGKPSEASSSADNMRGTSSDAALHNELNKAKKEIKELQEQIALLRQKEDEYLSTINELKRKKPSPFYKHLIAYAACLFLGFFLCYHQIPNPSENISPTVAQGDGKGGQNTEAATEQPVIEKKETKAFPKTYKCVANSGLKYRKKPDLQLSSSGALGKDETISVLAIDENGFAEFEKDGMKYYALTKKDKTVFLKEVQ